MKEIGQLIVFVFGFIIVCRATYKSLQRVDFSKLFKPNSATQIRLLILFYSICSGLIVGLGLTEFLGLIVNCIVK